LRKCTQFTHYSVLQTQVDAIFTASALSLGVIIAGLCCKVKKPREIAGQARNDEAFETAFSIIDILLSVWLLYLLARMIFAPADKEYVFTIICL
jgi:hypothetical protein